MQEEREELVRRAEIVGASAGNWRVMGAFGGLDVLGGEWRRSGGLRGRGV
jgi:hypothetical protein